MKRLHGRDLLPASGRIGELRRETRDGAALVLVALAIVVVMALVGLAVS